jgi:hypothetical protein
MSAFSLFLLLIAFVAVSSTAIRGSSTKTQELEQEQDGQLSSRRRYLLQEATCTLFRKCVSYLPTEDHPEGYHEDTWACELSIEDSERLEVQFVDIVENEAVADILANATSGESRLTVSEAIIESPRMYIPDNAKMRVGDHPIEPRTEVRRKLAPTKGTLTTLVIRVIDKNGKSPSASVAQLKNDVFDDDKSLKTQTERCSYNKLKIEPFSGKTPSNHYVNNGIVNVKMNLAVEDDGMNQAAMTAAKNLLGDLNDDRFGLVMFCFPPAEGFLAYAFRNNKYSFYNDEWCQYVAAQMHEVGHNIGLAHSGELGQGDYGDETGLMGSSIGKDDVSQCFNAQKNYQLGWYDDKVQTINPLKSGRRSEFTLNGVADYKSNPNALIALRLEQEGTQKDYYIGYNRAAGMHQDTSEDKNMVTILRKESGDPDKYGQSIKVASLSPGQRYTIDNFGPKDKNVQIAFIGIKEGDARIMVTSEKKTWQPDVGTCKKFTIEVNTDEYPSDTDWYVRDTNGFGEVFAASSEYTEKNKKYTQEICLPMGPQAKSYKFSISDKYGDGLCCSQGNGSYKAFTENGQLIFQGGQNFEFNTHTIQVPKDPNPPAPTRAPVAAPTPNPTPAPPCEAHIVEVRTDRYPWDTSWEIVDMKGVVVAESDGYGQKEELHRTTICLTENKNFRLKVLDAYHDGICCGNGEGYYRVLDSCSNVVVDSAKNDEDFSSKSHTFYVNNECGGGPSPTKEPTKAPKPNKRCRNKKKGKWKIKGTHGPSRTCQQHANKGRCDTVTFNGKFVWELCRKSCGKCNN